MPMFKGEKCFKYEIFRCIHDINVLFLHRGACTTDC